MSDHISRHEAEHDAAIEQHNEDRLAWWYSLDLDIPMLFEQEDFNVLTKLSRADQERYVGRKFIEMVRDDYKEHFDVEDWRDW